jgi:hypothetical protein
MKFPPFESGFVCGMMTLALCVSVSSCVHESITQPLGAGGAICGIDATGVVFTDAGRTLWLSEGVPAVWFTPDGANWHIDDPLYHAGQSLRLKNRNP